MRLFIALEVPGAWCAAAAAQQQALVAALPSEVRPALRLVRPELMHLTLRFLGEVDEGGVDSLQAALDGLAPFEVALALERAGTFGPAPRTGVVWLAVASEPAGELDQLDVLQRLVGQVELAVRLAGRRGDARPFSAHLTLARLARGATAEERTAVAEAVRGLDAPLPIPFVARELLLVRSYLEGPAPRYEVLSHHQ